MNNNENSSDEGYIENLELNVHKLSSSIKTNLRQVKINTQNFRKENPPMKIDVENHNENSYSIGIHSKRVSLYDFGNSIVASEAIANIFDYTKKKGEFLRSEKSLVSEMLSNNQLDAKSRIFLILSIWKLLKNIVKKDWKDDNIIFLNIPPYISPNLSGILKSSMEQYLIKYVNQIREISKNLEKINLCLISKRFRAPIFNLKQKEKENEKWDELYSLIGEGYQGFFLRNYLMDIGDRTPFFQYDKNIEQFIPNFNNKGFLFCYFRGPNDKIYQFEISKTYGDLNKGRNLIKRVYYYLEKSPFDFPLPLISAKNQISNNFLKNYLNILSKATGIDNEFRS